MISIYFCCIQKILPVHIEMEKDTNHQLAQELGLSKEEFEKIIEVLGKTPNFVELSIFSVMWSEHCSYKNSIHWLKKLPKNSDRMLVKAGEENAGLVDIGDGLACSFKIESHNHPSAIEPYQGAATAVGGINRDIFSMGARPIAQMNSLRFGDIHLGKTQWLVKGIVKGIGDYSNCFGIPTVGGEVFFDKSFNINPLVNAFSAGIVAHEKVVSAIAQGVGNPVFIVGSATGKDGIHGATFASYDISEDSAEELPSVQVGDPFQEKLLLEATLKLIDTGSVVGMQDMGAAGIICSASEMSAKGKHGMEIWLDKVPMRQQNMKAFEILLSESQERMLVVVKKGTEHIIKKVFDEWDLYCQAIGVVTNTERLHFYYHGKQVADVPAHALVLGGGTPVYEREYKPPAYREKFKKFHIHQIPSAKDYHQIAKHLLAHPNIASKAWIYRQYDSTVGTINATTNAPSDAALAHVKGTDKYLVLTVDCNSRYVKADPQEGCAMAVAEAARNIVCTGGEPLAITNCLNFGNPYVPQVYWQFVEAIKGMKKACQQFNTPVTGGNVSFYNQSTDKGPVFPTPTIGMMGLLEGLENRMTLDFKQAGDLIYLIGKPQECIASSEYLYSFIGEEASVAPWFDLNYEYQMQAALKEAIAKKWVNAAHDVSEGGLWIALVEAAMPRSLGFAIATAKNMRKDAFLFGESQSRVVVSVGLEKQVVFEKNIKTDYLLLGKVTKEPSLRVDDEILITEHAAKELYENTLPTYLEK